MTLEEGDVVLCTVEKIVGTTVFVKIEEDGTGTIVVSEIAPGRIRNLRDYVVPNKKIVCKILRIDKSGHIHLSLRRVTAKERKELTEAYKREKNSASILKTILKDKAEKTIEKIKEKLPLSDFLEQVKENPKILEKYVKKPEAEKILKILKEKKAKQVEVKKEFKLFSKEADGLNKIKKILSNENIAYLGSGKYTIKVKADNYKQANAEINNIIQEIEQKAKQEDIEFEVKEK